MQSVGGYGILAVVCASSWLSIGGYSIPAIPSQSTVDKGRVSRARMPYPPMLVAFCQYKLILTHLLLIGS